MDVSELARNNAAWCETVCRTHGMAGVLSDESWTSARRTPSLYPDAISLRPGVDRDPLLGAIDTAPGCSIKDSFADLDLEPAGFAVLFDAWWIYFEPGVRRSSSWLDVTDERTFRAWEAAWIAESGVPDVLLPSLMVQPGVRILADRRDGEIVAGAIAMRSGSVVGLTNLFARDGDGWEGCRDAIVARFPDVTIVGYETHDTLPFAQQAGFEPVAPLRVWIYSG